MGFNRLWGGGEGLGILDDTHRTRSIVHFGFTLFNTQFRTTVQKGEATRIVRCRHMLCTCPNKHLGSKCGITLGVTNFAT